MKKKSSYPKIKKHKLHRVLRPIGKPRHGWADAFKMMTKSIPDGENKFEEVAFIKAVIEGFRAIEEGRTLSLAKAKAKLAEK